MRTDLIPTMQEFNEMDRAEQIETLCAVHECNEKKRKAHRSAYLRGTNHHPPQRFLKWWNKDGIAQTESATDRAWQGIDAVRAFNCEAVREVYRQAKESELA